MFRRVASRRKPNGSARAATALALAPKPDQA